MSQNTLGAFKSNVKFPGTTTNTMSRSSRFLYPATDLSSKGKIVCVTAVPNVRVIRGCELISIWQSSTRPFVAACIRHNGLNIALITHTAIEWGPTTYASKYNRN